MLQKKDLFICLNFLCVSIDLCIEALYPQIMTFEVWEGCCKHTSRGLGAVPSWGLIDRSEPL